MKEREKSAVLLTSVKSIVAAVFVIVMAAIWLVTGRFPMSSGCVLSAICVLTAASLINVAECLIGGIGPDEKLLPWTEKTMREIRALADLLPLWGIAFYIIGVMAARGGLLVPIVVFAVVFFATTVPQAVTELPRKNPMLSTFLGRFVPLMEILVLFVLLITVEQIIIVETVMGGLLTVAIWAYVAKNWKVGMKIP